MPHDLFTMRCVFAHLAMNKHRTRGVFPEPGYSRLSNLPCEGR
jgi:hypothetical protein